MGKEDGDRELAAKSDRGALAWLTTITGNLTLFLSCLVFGMVAIFMSWIPPRRRWAAPVARGWARCVLWGAGVRVRRRYESDLDPTGRYIFMVNHQSLYDIPVVAVSLPHQFRFLAKRSLFRIPIFGWSLAAAGFVPVDRHHRERATETFTGAMGELRKGASLIVFPEETRSLDGDLGDFQRGGFLMALKEQMAIVPVGISGTLRVRRKGSLWTCPGVVEIGFGRPIDTSEYGVKRKNELIEAVRLEVGRLAAGANQIAA